MLAYAVLREDKRPTAVSEASALPAIGRSVAGVLARRTVLDQWLMVVALVFIAELVFSGLYAGRVFSVITSSIVLIVMLAETTRLYTRVARLECHAATRASEQADEPGGDGGVHLARDEQPITAMSGNSAAAARLIQREPPDLAEALSALKDIESDSRRADAILRAIGALFGKGDQEQERIDVNEVARAPSSPAASSAC